MKYKRITKIGNDAFKYGEYQGKYTVDKGDIIQLCTKYDCAYGGKAIDRLAELENAIENGELDRKDNSYNVLELEYLRCYKENREKVYMPIEPTASWFMGIKVRNEAKCSACNQNLSKEYEQFNYCPYCGARLR